MARLIVRPMGGVLHPVGRASIEAFEKLKPVPHVVAVKRSRNPDFLRRYWSICAVAADFGDDWDDREDVDHWVRMQIPSMRDTHIVEEDGSVIVRLRSISCDEMDETDFDEFYQRAMELLSAKIGTDVETLAREAWNRETEGEGK